MSESPEIPRRGIGAAGIFKVFLAGAMLGAAGGAWSVYQYVHAPFVHAVVDRGFCGQRDPFNTAFMYNCRDAAVAMTLQQQAIEHDQEAAAILADMRIAEPGKARKGKKP